jgi:hypothetical protein
MDRRRLARAERGKFARPAANLPHPAGEIAGPASRARVRQTWALLCDPPMQDRLVEIRDALGALSARQADLEVREAWVAKVECAMAALDEATR